jgi:hypothetical protein
MELQGNPGDGFAAGLMNVQWDIERILDILHRRTTHRPAPATIIEGQWHFAAQIKLALDKCKIYYAKLDDSAAILASSVLHPGRGWPFIKQLWKNKSQWVVAGKERVENLWLSHMQRRRLRQSQCRLQYQSILWRSTGLRDSRSLRIGHCAVTLMKTILAGFGVVRLLAAIR